MFPFWITIEPSVTTNFNIFNIPTSCWTFEDGSKWKSLLFGSMHMQKSFYARFKLRMWKSNIKLHLLHCLHIALLCLCSKFSMKEKGKVTLNGVLPDISIATVLLLLRVHELSHSLWNGLHGLQLVSFI